jgi:Rap1a immunity proteins
MKRITIIFVAFMILTTGERAIGGFASGNDLYAMCTSRGEPFTNCIGYVKGILDAAEDEGRYLDPSSASSTIAGFRWCLPDITLAQAVDVTIKFLRDNPERRHAAAAGLVAHAMEKAWSCPFR